MTNGAYESAERLVHRLLESPEACRAAGLGGQVLAAETLLMLGDLDRARRIADDNPDAMSRDARGASVLELVGFPRAPDFLPGGRPNLLRLSHRLARGELGARELVELLGSRRTWLRTPDLELLFFSSLIASDAPRAARFLSRFFARHGLPAATLSEANGSEDHVLSRMHFPRGEARSVHGPLVSVLMPAYNAASTIGYAVRSLFNQSYASLEVLVGDDASDDATLDILKARWPSEPRLRLFRSARNQGSYNVRNALVQRARGRFVTFHDADDLAFPDRIARQVAALGASGAVACVANFARVDRAGAFRFFKDQRAVRLGLVTLLLERRAFDEAGPFRSARVGADLELYTALQARFGPSRVRRIRSPLMFGLWSEQSVTRAAGTESLEDGYRSPPRRAYGELIVARYRTGVLGSNERLDERLREVGNYIEPAPLIEVT